MDWDVISLWKQMGWLSRYVVLVLLLMLMRTTILLIERGARFALARRQSRRAEPEIYEALREGRIDDALASAARYPLSAAARVIEAALRAFRAAPTECSDADTVAIVTLAAGRRRALVKAQMNANLGMLATIAYAAPFIGIGGTLVGILNSFRGECSSRLPIVIVSSGVAEALLPTAMGLMIAVSAAWFNVSLQARARALDTEMSNAAPELVNRLTAHPGLRKSLPPAAPTADGWLESGQVRPWEVPYDRQRTVLAPVLTMWGLIMLVVTIALAASLIGLLLHG